MKTLYRMAWYRSRYAVDRKKGGVTYLYMKDIRETVADAVSAYYEDSGEDSMDAAIRPERFLIYVISVEDDLGDDNDGIRNGIIEDILPLEKAYS